MQVSFGDPAAGVEPVDLPFPFALFTVGEQGRARERGREGKGGQQFGFEASGGRSDMVDGRPRYIEIGRGRGGGGGGDGGDGVGWASCVFVASFRGGRSRDWRGWKGSG